MEAAIWTSISCNVQFDLLIIRESTCLAYASPHMTSNHLIEAVGDYVASLFGLGFDGVDLVTTHLEDGNRGGWIRV